MSTRNPNCVPDLSAEGVFLKSLDVPPDEVWQQKERLLTPFERVHAHHTLASARRFACFQPFSQLIPEDSLDLMLDSTYDHTYELFPDSLDVYLQRESLGIPTWRKLRNTVDEQSAQDSGLIPYREKAKKIPYRLDKIHPVIISGVAERRHLSNIKLMNSSHHLPQTNMGYSRQDSDGNCYQY